jgi:hypothetical protein
MDFLVWKDINFENDLQEFVFVSNARSPPGAPFSPRHGKVDQYEVKALAGIKRK